MFEAKMCIKEKQIKIDEKLTSPDLVDKMIQFSKGKCKDSSKIFTITEYVKKKLLSQEWEAKPMKFLVKYNLQV